MIGEAIASALRSDFEDLEVIVVDDNSSDGTFDAVTPFLADRRVKAFRNDVNLGDNANRNRAASIAGGEYLKYLDSDDMIYPHALGVFVSAMDAHPEAGLGLSALPDDDRPFPHYLSPREAFLMHFCERNLFGRGPASSIIRRSAFQSVGGFGDFPGRGPLGDLDLWLRLASKHGLVRLPRDLVWDRRHPEQESAFQAAAPFARTHSERELERRALFAEDSPLDAREQARADERLRERDVAVVLRYGLAHGHLRQANGFRVATGVSTGMVARAMLRRLTGRDRRAYSEYS
jgi:glycosyltransferase involved in cell wall biosynthesis